ncbi:spastin-like isoform X1 [Phoenix dactylifera]|uniref:microtubule-severing ATPase n=1 Tax=Phoenix dactylifera TaxID=42345 RepID=A0A8B9A180_PHODC|nr:spastin-like isoform X1 [Phoenix dactylifera]
MSYLKGLFDSFSKFFSGVRPSDSSDPSPSPAAAFDRTMEGSAAGPSVVNERVVLKLKGYFELAKEEIDKAVRAEEWGLAEDAIAHYRNAHRVMLEAKAARVPAALPSSENDQVKAYQQKISKWQEKVAERLQVLGQRTEEKGPELCASFLWLTGMATKKASPSHTLVRTVSSTTTGAKKPVPQNLPSLKNTLTTGNQKNGNGGAKSAQDALSGYDARLVEMINTVIVDRSPAVKWDDVAGLEKAKQALMEMVILPTKRRDLFTGLRKPARGLLLFGPPGNGKTMLAKAVASESEATFFNISASSLTSKWVGEAEKLVRTLFMVAVARQPSVIFMDEIDSIMSTRLANENDASRRLKSEFLVQFDGVMSNQNDLVIVIGATNKPQELDDAVLRRLVKRIYIPLPDENIRRLLLKNQLKGQAFSLPSGDLERLVKETEGYSGSDLQALCEEAAMMPIRELGPQNILKINANQVRPLRYDDFRRAMDVIRPSLQKSKWEELEEWNKQFGSN